MLDVLAVSRPSWPHLLDAGNINSVYCSFISDSIHVYYNYGVLLSRCLALCVYSFAGHRFLLSVRSPILFGHFFFSYSLSRSIVCELMVAAAVRSSILLRKTVMRCGLKGSCGPISNSNSMRMRPDSCLVTNLNSIIMATG